MGVTVCPKGSRLVQGSISATTFKSFAHPRGDRRDRGNGSAQPVQQGALLRSDKITEDLSAGLGIFNYFGAALNYNNTWVGRYYNVESQLLGYTFMPTVSYRITDWISVGAGLNPV
jgi:long-subunit fatty acid transport protein